jgi:hypothetical protein
MTDDAITRLARQIDLAERERRFLVNAEDVAALRRRAAAELHQVCAQFVAALNGRLSATAVDISPATYAPEMFRESGVNLIQIGSQGRELQIVFEAPPQLVSTEKFRIPYILEGELRAYNQKMLERFDIRTLLIFFCVELDTAAWRFFDWRTLRTGPVDGELLVNFMQPLF